MSPFLSFCIPTFNRKYKLISLVKEILKYENNDIEIIILDNCSTDGTAYLLSKIEDHRLSYFLNEVSLDGSINPIKALTLAKGKYGLLCLDKDTLISSNINYLIESLKKNENIVFGHCSLNIMSIGNDLIYERGYMSLINMAFLSEHPSGTFYKIKYFKNLFILKKILTEKKKFGFYIDIINAEMSFIGKSLFFNKPLVNTESKQECAKTATFTYSGKDVFFKPILRIKEYEKYINVLCDLSCNLKIEESKVVISKLYYTIKSNATFGFKDIMSDELICSHYGVRPRKVNLFELLKINFLFSYHFIKQKLPISYFDKSHIFFIEQKKFFYKLLRRMY
ncbi:MAG: glycosyltransferase [Bacteroidetes bacterium]|nr:glycosyltransferase [Bacteroidota bacterium]